MAVPNASRPLISIVSPAYNEEDNLAIFYRQLCAVVDGADFDVEFVIVDDGSHDRTSEILRELAAHDPRVRGLLLSRNFGAISACAAGLHHAVGDAAILMSSDLQEPASNVVKLVEQWRKGFDIVWAVRASRDDPFFKSLFADCFYWVIRRAAFPDYPKRGTDSGLFSRAALNVYRALPERDSTPFYAFYTYGFRQSFVPYDRLPRLHGQSGWSFRRRVKSAIDVITTFTAAPIRLITALSALAMMASMLGILYILLLVIFVGAAIPGWPSVMVTALFIGATQLFGLSVAASYIWRIDELARQRPRYIIAEAFGAETMGPILSPPNPIDPGASRD